MLTATHRGTLLLRRPRGGIGTYQPVSGAVRGCGEGRARGIVTAMNRAISSDAEIMGGTPCLAGTRVPFQTLLDYLEGGSSLDEFLEDFPSVGRQLAVAALQHAGGWQSRRSIGAKSGDWKGKSLRLQPHFQNTENAGRVASSRDSLCTGESTRRFCSIAER
jgi:uncharacterized protein (DUF433 family)